MGFHGNLRTMHLGDVFQNISQNRSTGNLCISTKELGNIDLFFMEGELALYHSRNLEEIQWSRVFLARGDLSEEEVAVVESQGIRGEEELAGIISSQVISEEKAAINFQHIIEEEIYELFMNSDCDFSFEGATEIPGVYTYTDLFKRTVFNVNMILMEAARRSDENSQEGNISSHEIFTQVQDKEKAVRSNLEESEWLVYDLVDGFRNVAEIVRDSGSKRQDVVKMLKHLLELKLIKISDTKDLLAKASHLASIQDYDSAAKVYRRLIDMEKAVLSHRELLADTFLHLQQKENAIMQLEIMTNEYAQRKDYKKANDGLSRILEIDPTRLSVREVIAGNYFEMGKKKDAVSELKGVLQAYIDSGVFEKAKVVCTKLLAIDPDDLKVMDLMAKTCVSRGDRAQATEIWERMSEIYYGKDNYEEATETLKKILKTEPSNDRAKELLNTIAIKQGKVKTRQTVVVIVGAILLVSILVASGLLYIENRTKLSLADLKNDNDHLVTEIKNSTRQSDVELKTKIVVERYEKFKEDHPYSFTRFDIREYIDDVERIKNQKLDEFNKVSIERMNQLEDDYTIVMEGADKKMIIQALADLDAYHNRIKDDPKFAERLQQVESKITVLKSLETEAQQKLAVILEAVQTGDLAKANELSKDLLANYTRTSVMDKVMFYVNIQSSENDSRLRINEQDIAKPLPLTYAYKPNETLKIEVQKEGYYDFQDEVKEGQKTLVQASLKRKILWTFDLQNPMNASPLYQEGSLFLFSRNGKISALAVDFKKDSFRELWSLKMNLPSSDIMSTGLLENDLSYVGSSDHHIYCINIAAGREQWKQKLNGPINSSVALTAVSLRQDQKMIFASVTEASEEGSVVGLDAANGTIIWQKKVRGRSFADVLAAKSKIYIGTDQNKIVVLRSSTGAPIEIENEEGKKVPLEYKSFGQFKGSMLLRSVDHNEYVMASSLDQNIYCFDEKSGRKIWNFPTSSVNTCGVVADDQNLYNSSANGLITSIKIVDSIREGKPVINWSIRYENFKEPTPVYATDSILYVGGTMNEKKGKLLAIRKNDGKVLWTLETPASINSRPLVAESRVFVGCDDNKVYVLKELK